VDGLVLLFFFFIFLYYVFELAKREKKRIPIKEFQVKDYDGLRIFFMIAGGLTALYFGGQWVVKGAIFIAHLAGLSEFFISATVVAIGTSLLELFTSVVAALRKQPDIAVGNIVGSNIFNIFLILAVTFLIAPIAVPPFINFDMAFLMMATVLLFAAMFIGKRHVLEPWQGFIFVILYCVYVALILIRG